MQAINRRRLKSGKDQKPILYYIDPTGGHTVTSHLCWLTCIGSY